MSQGAKGIYGVTDTFDGSSNDLSGTTGDLKDPMESNGVLRGPRGSRRAFRGSVGANRYVKGIPRGHRVCLVGLLMIYACIMYSL